MNEETMGAADRPATVGALVLAGVLAFLGIAWPVVRGRGFENESLADLNHASLPFRASYARALAAGDSPFWCPDLLCGFNLHGEGQVGMAHPWHWPLYRYLPTVTALFIELLANYPALLLGTYLFLRRWGLPREAALVGGIAFAFSGYTTRHLEHVNAIDVIAHFPWLLLAIDLGMRGPDPRRSAWAWPALAVLVGSMLLCGYPQYVVFALILGGSYAAWLAPRSPAPVSRLACCAGAVAVGFLIGGVQLLPTREALAESYREAPGAGFNTLGSMNPANLLQAVGPYLFARHAVARGSDALVANEFAFYNGAAMLPLLAWLFVLRRDLGRWRPLAAWAALLGLLALCVALGRHTPVFAVWRRLPGMNLFRMPVRYVVLLHFCLACLSAVGYATLAARRERPAWRRLWPLALPPLASLLAAALPPALAALRPGSEAAGVFAGPALVLLGPVLVGLATALVALAARGSGAARLLLGVTLALDLVVYGVCPLYRRPPSTIDGLLAALAQPPAPPTAGRIDADNDMYILLGYRLSGGYVALDPKRALDRDDPTFLRLASVRWRLRPGDEWERVEDPLPRARLVTRAVVSADPAADLATIDPATTALVEADPGLADPDTEPGRARLTADRPGRIEVATDAPAPGRRLLVVSESFNPGWQALVDGRPAPVVRVYHDFLGCVVEGGRRSVVFRYAPAGVRLGLMATGAGLAVVLLYAAVLAAVSLRRPRPGAAP